jgi:hypothetical protein
MRCDSLTLRLGAVLAGVLVAAPARGQAITSVEGLDGLAQGTIDTVVHINGSGFGEKKPKVTLTDAATGKAYKLKVTQHGETHVLAIIKQAIVGELQLAVVPEGAAAAPALAPAPFTVLPMVVEPLDGPPAYGQIHPTVPGEGTFVHGIHFGTGKLTARVAGKAAKVYSSDDDRAYVRVPGSTPPGEQLLELSNGASSCSGTVWVWPQKKKHPDTLAPKQVSLQLMVDEAEVAVVVTKAMLGQTLPADGGAPRLFLKVDATMPAIDAGLHFLVRFGEGDVAPTLLEYPFIVGTGEAGVQISMYSTLPFWFLAGAGSSPPPGGAFGPKQPFEITLEQLDPQAHTAQLQFAGTLGGGPWGGNPPTFVIGSLTIAP